MSQLIKEYPAIADDPLNAVNMKIALIDHFAAGIDGQEFTRYKAVVFIFDGVYYSFHNYYIIAYISIIVNALPCSYP